MTTEGLTVQQHSARLLLLAVVCGVVLGIFGMHGLSQTPSHDVVAVATSSSPIDGLQAAAMPAMTTVGDGHHGHGSPGHGVDCDLIACCLVVMFGGALLVWALLIRRAPRPTAWMKRVSAIVREHANSVPRRPPDLIRLSILRC